MPPKQTQSIEANHQEEVHNIVQSLQKLALSRDPCVPAPSFDGDPAAVEDWITQARLFLEDSEKTGRQAVRHLASRFTKDALHWFGRLKISPNSEEELIQLVITEFQNKGKEFEPIDRFYQALRNKKDPKLQWTQYFKELKHLSELADMKESRALATISQYDQFATDEVMSLATSWDAVLRLAETRDRQPSPVIESEKKEQSGVRKSFFTSANKQSSSFYSAARTRMLVNGVEVPVIADSGSGITIISESLVNRLQLKKSNDTTDSIITAGGQQVSSKGKVRNLNITLDSMTFFVDAIVLPVKSYQLLLGNDILDPIGAHIDFESHKMWLKGKNGSMHQVTFQAKQVDPKEKPVNHKRTQLLEQLASEFPKKDFKLVARSATIIPPWNEVMLPIELRGKPPREGCYLVNQMDWLIKKHGIMTAAGILETTNFPDRILITNMSNLPYTVAANQQIAFLTPVENSGPYECLFVESQEDAVPPPSLPDLKIDAFWKTDKVDQQYRHKLETLLTKHRDRLCGTSERPIGKYTKGQIDVPTVAGAKPVFIPPRRTSPVQEKFVNTELKKYQDFDLISPSVSSWASPLVIARKKDGNFRMCVDYRKLNEVVIKDVYPMPRIDDSLHTMHGAKFFSVMDLKSGYHQLPIKPEDRWKTAFSTKFGLFEFNTLPFGLTHAPAAFQRVMDAVLHGLRWEFCLVYLDDIIIFSPTFEKHLEHLELVFERLEDAGLTINASKCQFCVPEVKYLGHLVSAAGVKASPERNEELRNFLRPTSPRQVKQFLGLVGYYRRFILGYSDIAAPLFPLTSEKTPFIWTAEAEKAFNILKEKLLSPPILAHPDYTKPFTIQTDASSKAIGAILTQKVEGNDVIVDTASRILNSAERNYSATDRECLAVVWAVEKFRHYIYGSHFTIQTDHSALTHMKTARDPHHRLARYAMILSEYDYDIVHRSGKANSNVDTLSRYGYEEGSEEGNIQARTREHLEQRDVTQRVEEVYAIISENESPQEEAITLENQKTSQEANEKMISSAHIITGHGALQPTKHMLRNFPDWQGSVSDIQRFLDKCKLCQKFNQRRMQVQSQPLVVEQPFERVQIDMIGPIPNATSGNTMIITAIDCFTGFAITEAVPDKSAETIVNFLVKSVFAVFGFPRIIQSDQGTEFANALVKNILERNEITQSLSSPYHPQSNGAVERLNQTLVTKLAKLCAHDRENWDKYVPAATLAYNLSYKEKLKASPFEVMFGRSFVYWGRNPVIVGLLHSQGPNPHQQEETVRRSERIVAYQELLRQRIRKAAEEVVRKEAHLRQPDYLEIGDVVSIRIRQRDGKTGERWDGPYYVRTKGTKGSYSLEGLDGSITQANISDVRVDQDDEDVASGKEGDTVGTAVAKLG